MQHVVVIGAGIVGLLTAYELRRRGHRVEMRSVGVADGATFAAAGMLAPAAEIQFGQGPLWTIMREAEDDHRALAEQLRDRTGTSAGYRDDSTLVVGRDHADIRSLRDVGGIQRATGAGVQDLSGAEAREREPALPRGIAGAQLIDRDHQVDPRVLTATIRELLAARGEPGDGPPVPIRQERIDDLDDLEADRIVLAAGLGVTGIEGPHRLLDLPLRPVRGDVLRVRVPDMLLLPGEEHLIGRTIRASVRGRSVYVVPRDDRQLVIGATSREDDLAGPSTGGVLQLLQDASEILPSLRETEIVEVIARDRPGTPDDLPLLGPVPVDPRVILSTGFHRHGVLLAPWAARRIAELLAARPEAWSEQPAHLHAVRPDRFTVRSPDPTRPEEKP